MRKRNLFDKLFGNDNELEELIETMAEKQCQNINDIVEIKTELKSEIKRLDEKITGLIAFFGISLTIITIVISVHLHDIDKNFDAINNKIDFEFTSVQKQVDLLRDEQNREINSIKEDLKEIKELLKQKKK